MSELQKAVSDTISAIKLVPNAALMKGLTWSIAVAALASEGDHRVFFKELGQGILVQFGECQTFNALNIAFEFWKLRDSMASEKEEFSWKEALSYEGGATLLFL